MISPFKLAAMAILCALALQPASGHAGVRQEINCLALNLYHEARGEPDLGKIAVGQVVMNRVANPQFPGTVCQVVRDGGEWPQLRCQFTWWCDGRSDEPRDARAWQRSRALARKVYWGYAPDPTHGALWYHADYASPRWAAMFDRGPMIGRHIFYRPRPGREQRQARTQTAELPLLP